MISLQNQHNVEQHLSEVLKTIPKYILTPRGEIECYLCEKIYKRESKFKKHLKSDIHLFNKEIDNYNCSAPFLNINFNCEDLEIFTKQFTELLF